MNSLQYTVTVHSTKPSVYSTLYTVYILMHTVHSQFNTVYSKHCHMSQITHHTSHIECEIVKFYKIFRITVVVHFSKFTKTNCKQVYEMFLM